MGNNFYISFEFILSIAILVQSTYKIKHKLAKQIVQLSNKEMI